MHRSEKCTGIMRKIANTGREMSNRAVAKTNAEIQNGVIAEAHREMPNGATANATIKMPHANKGMTGTGKKAGIALLLLSALAFGGCGSAAPAQTVDYRNLAEPLNPNMGEDTSGQSDPLPSADLSPAEGTQHPTEDAAEISITISAAGDVTLGNHQEQEYAYSFRQAYDQAEDKSIFFQNVYDIFSQDDMTLVNLEGPLTLSDNRREGQVYSIKGDPSYVELLTLGSIEAVSMANNHRLDYGEQGCLDTVEALKNAGIVYAYESNVGIYETKGIRIGFVAVNEVSQGSTVEKTLQDGIGTLKEQGVDLILACCHWGVEKDNYPESYQQTLGRKCIDWGADLVIGHHPHVLQGIEEYQGKYILYSLGNFCFGANRNPSDKDTIIFQQTFTFVDGNRQEDKNIRIIPCSVSSVSTRNDFCPTPAQGEDAERIIHRMNEYSADYGVAFSEEGYLK